jgi:CelD/BcsL family acetyltransferase involved in cellulose biosynthesis
MMRADDSPNNSPPGSEARPLSAEILDGTASAAALESEWLALFQRLEGVPWSCHPAVFRLWSELFRQAGSTRLLAVRDAAGELRGIMPLMHDRVWRGPSATPRFDYDPRDGHRVAGTIRRPLPLRQLTTMASLPATMLWVGPLCDPAEAGPVTKAMAEAIIQVPGWDVLVLPAEEGEDRDHWVNAFTLLGALPCVQRLGRRVQNIRSLEPFGAIVGRQSKKFRQNVRRAQAAAHEAGLRFEFHAGMEGVARALPAVASIARASWKHTGRKEADVHIPYEGDQRDFFERLFREISGAEPVVGIASGDAGPVAAILLLRHGGTVTTLLTFWNGGLPSASPGLLLLGRTIDWAGESGALRVDLNATAPWVRHLVDDERSICHAVVFGNGPWGRALGALARRTGRFL